MIVCPFFLLWLLSLSHAWTRPPLLLYSNSRQRRSHWYAQKSSSKPTTTSLFAKGIRGAQNKQAALKQKLELAKKQKGSDNQDDSDEHHTTVDKSSDEDDARAEFAKLLANSKPPPRQVDNNDIHRSRTSSTNVGLAKQLTAKNNKGAPPKAKQRPPAPKRQQHAHQEQDEDLSDEPVVLRPGDKARRRDWEPLVHVRTGQPLGPIEAAALVPWVPPFVTDYVLVVVDPRRHSSDFRLAVPYVLNTHFSSTSKTKRGSMVAIAADESVAETRAWMERAGILVDKDNNHNSVAVLLDTSASLQWMRTYACCDGSWSTHVLLIDNDGRIQHNVGGVKPSEVCQIVADMIAPYEQ